MPKGARFVGRFVGDIDPERFAAGASPWSTRLFPQTKPY
jgi:hypothetical protein